MPASTALITDISTVITNGPNAATTALAIAAGGPIMDYPGMTQSLKTGLQEIANLLSLGSGVYPAVKGIMAVTDASDPNLTNLTAIERALIGQSAPSGTLITAINAVVAAGPTAATTALAIAAAGPIMDYPGCVKLVQMKLNAALIKVTQIIADTATSDSTNKTLLQNIQTALS